MSPGIPEYVDPWRLADSAKLLSGQLAISRLPRLAKEVEQADGEVAFELDFYVGHRKACAKGWVTASLILQCQRCMQPMTVTVETQLRVAFVLGPDEAEQLPEDLDPMLLDDDGKLHLFDLIEDELLLAMPQVSSHEEADCSLKLSSVSPEIPDKEKIIAEQSENPFAALAAFKADKP